MRHGEARTRENVRRSPSPPRSEAKRRWAWRIKNNGAREASERNGGISGSDYSAVINQTGTKDLENNLANMNKTDASDAEMMEACKEFEAYMVEQIYKSMEKTIIKADEEENEYESYFGDMRIQQYAKQVVAQGNLGLAQQLYESMKRNQGTSPADITEE